jgi:mono/diheme cytochrome c family protein
MPLRHDDKRSWAKQWGSVALAWATFFHVAAAHGAPAAFTKAQVTAGHASYHGYCSGCHRDNLAGGGLEGGSDAPPLTGALFRANWSKYTIRTLYQYVSKDMPAGLEGDLSPKTYADIVSFLLAANGAKAGKAPLDPNSPIKIGDIADGHTVAAVVNAPIESRTQGQ